MMKCLALLWGSLRPWLAGDCRSKISILFFSLVSSCNSHSLCYYTGFYQFKSTVSVPKSFPPWTLMDSCILFSLAFRQSVSLVRIAIVWIHVSQLPRCLSGGAGALARYSVSPPRLQMVPPGDSKWVPLQDHPHCQNGHSLLWSICNDSWVVSPAPSIRLHPPLPYIHALLVQFPFLRPKVLTTAFITGISVARPGSDVSLKKRIEVQR